MKNTIYKELFSLVRHDGEHLVVINPETDDGVVVMRLSEFKKLRGDSEDKGQVPESLPIVEKEPILAKKEAEDLSFWEASKHSTEENTVELDNKGDSGRIHERKKRYC